MTALVQSWLVIVSIELYLSNAGSFTIKSIVIVENGWTSDWEVIGCSGEMLEYVIILLSWH